MGKYDPLRDYLAGRLSPEVKMAFSDVEQLVGPLPASARLHRAWWANDSKSEAQAWRSAGWRVKAVNQGAEWVLFARSGVTRPQAPTPTKSASSRNAEDRAQVAPGPVVTRLSPGTGLPEATVQSLLVRHLVSRGWEIERVADTASREQGVDVIAARDGRILAVEVKGFPGTAYADPSRSGETKKATPPTQARVWFAQAILKAMLTRNDHPEYDIAIALPDFPTYQSLHKRTRSSLDQLGITIMFVTAEGNVH